MIKMLGWFLLGILLGATIITISYTVVHLTRSVLESKMREARQQVKKENQSLNGTFSYIIKEKAGDIAVVHLLHEDETVAKVSFSSELGTDSDLKIGLCNRV